MIKSSIRESFIKYWVYRKYYYTDKSEYTDGHTDEFNRFHYFKNISDLSQVWLNPRLSWSVLLIQSRPFSNSSISFCCFSISLRSSSSSFLWSFMRFCSNCIMSPITIILIPSHFRWWWIDKLLYVVRTRMFVWPNVSSCHPYHHHMRGYPSPCTSISMHDVTLFVLSSSIIRI